MGKEENRIEREAKEVVSTIAAQMDQELAMSRDLGRKAARFHQGLREDGLVHRFDAPVITGNYVMAIASMEKEERDRAREAE